MSNRRRGGLFLPRVGSASGRQEVADAEVTIDLEIARQVVDAGLDGATAQHMTVGPHGDAIADEGVAVDGGAGLDVDIALDVRPSHDGAAIRDGDIAADVGAVVDEDVATDREVRGDYDGRAVRVDMHFVILLKITFHFNQLLVCDDIC